MYDFLWMFFIYAFLGWCVEVCYAALNTGKFVNRGFLNGPLCPIYGFGAVLVLHLLQPLNESLLLLFAGSVLLTSALEWLTGFVLEKLFHQRWWDYSRQPFNLGGYICLKFSLAWGVACLFVVRLIHPSILLFIHLIPRSLGAGMLLGLAVYGIVDLISTVRTIIHFNAKLSRIDQIAGHIRAHSDQFGEALAEHVVELVILGEDRMEELDELSSRFADRLDTLDDDLKYLRDTQRLQRKLGEMELRDLLRGWKTELDELFAPLPFGQRRLLNAFPKLRSVNHAQALEKLRRRLEQR